MLGKEEREVAKVEVKVLNYRHTGKGRLISGLRSQRFCPLNNYEINNLAKCLGYTEAKVVYVKLGGKVELYVCSIPTYKEYLVSVRGTFAERFTKSFRGEHKVRIESVHRVVTFSEYEDDFETNKPHYREMLRRFVDYSCNQGEDIELKLI